MKIIIHGWLADNIGPVLAFLAVSSGVVIMAVFMIFFWEFENRLSTSRACADAYPSTVWADGIEGTNGAVWCYLTDDDGVHTVEVIGGMGMYRNKPYVADAEPLPPGPRELCSIALPDSIYKWYEKSHSGNILCHMDDGTVYPEVVWLDAEGALLK